MKPLFPKDARSFNGHSLWRALGQTSAFIFFALVGVKATSAALASEPFSAPASQVENVFGSLLFCIAAILFTVLAIFTVLYLRERRRWQITDHEQTKDIIALRQQVDQAEAFLSNERQLLIIYNVQDETPIIEGDISLAVDVPMPSRVLAFGLWLKPESAQALDHHVALLRDNGTAFAMTAQTNQGKYLAIEGSVLRGRAMLRMRDVTTDRLEILNLKDKLSKLEDVNTLMLSLLSLVPAYVWMRDANGRLCYVNEAYVKAVELPTVQATLAAGVELLERPLRDQARTAHRLGKPFIKTDYSVVGSERHLLAMTEVANAYGELGLAYDLQKQDLLRLEIEGLHMSHGRTLDQLSTAVAIFDSASNLQFFNAAYRQLWQLDAEFLEQKPQDGEILDRLRLERKLPEEADFRKWKAGLFANYNATEPSQFMWYLPKGEILRVIISPNAQGGVTYLYDDITNYFQLEQKFNGLMRTQNETLDSLKEGVGVFGTDGRLKLFNLAFQDLWRIAPKQLDGQPHIDQVVKLLSPLYRDENFWLDLCATITGVHDARVGFERALPREDGSVLDCTTTPLPDGGTLVTFADVTAKVSVARALTERNQALLDAERLRSTFLQHVSYELRTPLTNIIGFTQFLENESIGSLNAKQKEYVGHVMASSSALFAIINDILDLATIDAGAMELALSDIDISKSIHEAMEGLADRIAEGDYDIQVIVADNIGTLQADAKRVRQVLFNVMSNAIGFSDPGSNITVAALRRGEEIVIKVSDHGRGIPPEILAKVFERFETHTAGTRHRGLGLGLSIVRSFVELHGGRVMIDSVPNQGTVVTCIFPVKAKGLKSAPQDEATQIPQKSA